MEASDVSYRREGAPRRQPLVLGVAVAVVLAACVGSYTVGRQHGREEAAADTRKFMLSAPAARMHTRARRPLRAEDDPAADAADAAPAEEAAPAAPPVAEVKNAWIEEQAGVIKPTGFWDPLGLARGSTDVRLKYFQEAETKHGRVAMLAALGFLVAERFHPLFGGDINVPSYIAFQETPLQTFWPLVLIGIAQVEYFSVRTFKDPTDPAGQEIPFGNWALRDDHVTGNLGFDPLGLKPADPNKLKEMKTKELQNGRLAMIGIAGMVAQELVSNDKIVSTRGAASAAEIDSHKVLELANEMATFLDNSHGIPFMGSH